MTTITCSTSHYATIVDAQKNVEIYQVGDVDCMDCLRRMMEKHATVVEIFRARLVKAQPRLQPCRVHDTYCIDPVYCDARDACCAGDPDCGRVIP